MDRPGYFQTALSNFAIDAACGGAVRHLTDIGYTLEQIVDRLDYPAPRAKVQKIMMEYLYESRILLKSEPSPELFVPKAQYIQEQDSYGRRTMRRVERKVDSDGRLEMTNVPGLTLMSQNETIAKTREYIWKEITYNCNRDGKLTELLHRKCEEGGEMYSYMSCAFGFLNNDQYSQEQQKMLNCLNNRQLDYLRGIRWENSVMYHRLNQRMLEIIGKLYEAGVYDGVCFFVGKREKLIIKAG